MPALPCLKRITNRGLMNIQKILNQWLTAKELVIISGEEREVLMSLVEALKGSEGDE